MTDNETPIADNTSLDQAVPRQSQYLTKEDCGDAGMIVTVAGLAMADLENDGKTDRRTILKFHGECKPMVLNQTNKELLKIATGETTAGGVKGKQIIVFNDPTIMFGGKVTGGIRIKSVPQQQTPAMPQAAQSFDDGNIPY
jgi:hypothetical protein